MAVDENCKGGQIHIEVRSVDGKWRYDCLFDRNGKSRIALEIVHTHYTTEEKVLATRLSGIDIVEFRASDVLAMVPGSKLENLLEKQIKCLDCLVQEGKCWLRDLYFEEFQAVCNFECTIENEYYAREKFFFKKIELRKQIAEADLKFMLRVWDEEIREIVYLQTQIQELYTLDWNILTFRKLIQGKTSIEKAQMIFMEYYALFYILHPRFGEISIENIQKKEDRCGVYINEWTANYIANEFYGHHKLYVYFFENDRDIQESQQWKPYGIERSCVIFLRTSKIISDLSILESKYRNEDDYDHHTFKDCKWPILKNIEKIRGNCANCGILGHASEDCKQLWCIRCGRKGHTSSKCFAKTHINGALLDWKNNKYGSW
jgi:hypothetical protein